MENFSQKLHLLQGSNLLEAAADGISQLIPFHMALRRINGWFFMLIYICLFFLFLHSLAVNHQESQWTTSKLVTITLASMINNNHQK